MIKPSDVVWTFGDGKERRSVVVLAADAGDRLLVVRGRGNGARPLRHVTLATEPALKAGFRKATHFYVDGFEIVSVAGEVEPHLMPSGRPYRVPRATLDALLELAREAFGERGFL